MEDFKLCRRESCRHISPNHPGEKCQFCDCTAVWQPNVGPQSRFVRSTAIEILYGGQAGGGKTEGLVAQPLRWVANPKFRALIVRRETTQLTKLLDTAEKIYPRLGARPRGVGPYAVTWRFPEGATVRFNHCRTDDDVASYDGDEFQFLGFDELTHFTEKQYRGLRARVRSPEPDLPRYSRSTTNPGGDGHAWVFRRWGPWLDPDCKAEGLTVRHGKPPADPGQVLWFLPTPDGTERWVPEGTTAKLPDGSEIVASSRTFIPAKLSDNPFLAADTDYRLSISDLDPVRRAQLQEGNWLVSYSSGTLFQRGWFEIVDARPASPLARVRVWDRAATKPSTENPDPDWTRGALISRDSQGLYYVEDMASCRDRPMAVDQLMKTTAEIDGRSVPIIVFQDPGSAGVAEADAMVRQLAGWTVKVVKVGKSDGDKITRAKPASAQAERRNIKLVRGFWNKPFLDELDAFPTVGVHDDQVDVLSTGVSAISPTSAAARFAMLAQL